MHKQRGVALAFVAIMGAMFAAMPADAKRRDCVALVGGADQLLAAARSETDAGARRKLAILFADCLDDPDPDIRDGAAFTGLSAMLRGGDLDDQAKRELLARLGRLLTGPADKRGFRRPFAALALSEVARADLVSRYLSDDEWSRLVAISAGYLAGIEDYRGFDDRDGWRHGVAHGADLMMQISRNPRLTNGEAGAVLDAIGAQVAPSAHAYTFGEPARLARPVLFLAINPNVAPLDWSGFVARLADPKPLGGWDEAFKSSDQLARLHNVKAFLTTLYIDASLSESERLKPVADLALKALRELP